MPKSESPIMTTFRSLAFRVMVLASFMLVLAAPFRWFL